MTRRAFPDRNDAETITAEDVEVVDAEYLASLQDSLQKSMSAVRDSADRDAFADRH